jgi:hypothetical protein
VGMVTPRWCKGQLQLQKTCVCVCGCVCLCVCVGHSNFEVNEVKPHETISNPRRGEIFYGHKCNLDLIFFFLLQLHK